MLDGRRAARLLHLPRDGLAGHQARHALDADAGCRGARLSAAADAQGLIARSNRTDSGTARATPRAVFVLAHPGTRRANSTLRLMPDDRRQWSIVVVGTESCGVCCFAELRSSEWGSRQAPPTCRTFCAARLRRWPCRLRRIGAASTSAALSVGVSQA